ncbi:MAG TPA: hypothetical protein DEB24_07280 [Coriobacteriia bacterium]|nr:hypothetical protein [Coriobacteriia bacterium]
MGNEISNGLLLIITITLMVIAYRLPKRNEADDRLPETKEPRVIESLSLYKGTLIEYNLRQPSSTHMNALTGRGEVLDFDSEWLLLSCKKIKGREQRIIRISQIAAVKGIKG